MDCVNISFRLKVCNTAHWNLICGSYSSLRRTRFAAAWLLEVYLGHVSPGNDRRSESSLLAIVTPMAYRWREVMFPWPPSTTLNLWEGTGGHKFSTASQGLLIHKDLEDRKLHVIALGSPMKLHFLTDGEPISENPVPSTMKHFQDMWTGFCVMEDCSRSKL